MNGDASRISRLDQWTDVCACGCGHRWGLDHGGRVTVVDLGDAVILLPPGSRQNLLANALTAEQHRRIVGDHDDPDLATT